jgi:hypothetical protein
MDGFMHGMEFKTPDRPLRRKREFETTWLCCAVRLQSRGDILLLPVLDSSLSMRRFGRYLLCGRVSWNSSLQLYQAADEGIGKQYQRFSTTQAMRALFPLQQ